MMRRVTAALGAFFLFAFAAFAQAVPSAQAAQAAAPHVPIVVTGDNFYKSLARHAQRWLREEQIASDIVAADALAKTSSKAALLIGFDRPTAAELAELKAFRARGGKFIVFYSSSPALAAMMSVKVLSFKRAAYPGQFSRMDFAPSRFPEGLPATLRQTSTVLQSSTPLKGARVLATWKDRKGLGAECAWIASGAGYWCTHVYLADGDEREKARSLAAMLGSLDARLWNLKAANARARARDAALRAYALKQAPRKGEIHAVWEHSGCGLYPGDWKKTMRVLKAARVSDLFVNVAGAGFAHYPSRVLPRSKTYAEEGDQLAAALAAAEGTGIRVHAWILCFTGTRGTIAKPDWKLKDRDGKTTEYLNPANAEVRETLLRAIDELQAKYPALAGIHLDFVRWYERAVKPANAAETISKFVSSARAHVLRPRWLTAAVLGKYPQCVASVGQDWDSWLNAGLVDYIVPMNYTENKAKYEEFLAVQGALKSHARRTIGGIGVTANESRLDARAVIDQIQLARRYGFAGVALFDLDVVLERQIFPYLTLGIW